LEILPNIPFELFQSKIVSEFIFADGVQNDFVLPTGSLSVSSATPIVPVVNALVPKFKLIVWTQDKHAPNDVSFASNHAGRKVYDAIDVGYRQVLFPGHWVADPAGAAVESGLNAKPADVILKKGTNFGIDSYSCFFDIIKTNSTNCHAELQKRGVKTLSVLGVATDYCVRASVVDAVALGYKVFVMDDGIAAVDPAAGVAAIADLKAQGAVFVKSSDVTL
jgi:nicotinamidase/pyrazinamidase